MGRGHWLFLLPVECVDWRRSQPTMSLAIWCSFFLFSSLEKPFHFSLQDGKRRGDESLCVCILKLCGKVSEPVGVTSVLFCWRSRPLFVICYLFQVFPDCSGVIAIGCSFSDTRSDLAFLVADLSSYLTDFSISYFSSSPWLKAEFFSMHSAASSFENQGLLYLYNIKVMIRMQWSTQNRIYDVTVVR